MFKSLQNVQSAFALTRIFLILTSFISVAVVSVAIFMAFRFAEKQRQRIYVLDGGKSLIMALSQDVNQNRIAEAKSHARRFHENFFTVSPDREAIEHNISQALAMASRDAADQYARMLESGFYDRIIAAGISCEIHVDSVVVDDSVYPFVGKCYGKTSIIRSSNVTFRNLETEFELINCARSEQNPHGFLLDKWRIIDNSDISVIER